MDEKTATTVEFLRARLFSERIVSKASRQRAELLAQRVVELEEQLRTANDQRRKIEKAVEEVLFVLETHGITNISGLSNSSTGEADNKFYIHERNFCMDNNDVKDYNCSSCKSHGRVPEKHKTEWNEHRLSGFTVDNSSHQQPEKTCRGIKKHNSGSTSENKPHKHDFVNHGIKVSKNLDDFEEKREYPLEASSSNSDDFFGETDDVKMALEQQASLISHFQAMEIAQEEWENNFNHTKMPMHVNAADENSSCYGDNLIPQLEEEKNKVKDISLTDNKKPESCTNCKTINQKLAIHNSLGISPPPPAPPASPDVISGARLSYKQLNPRFLVHDDNRKIPEVSFFSEESMPKKKLLEVTEPSRRPSPACGGMEAALQQARISLKRELVSKPSPSTSAQLKLPSNSFHKIPAKPSIYGSGLRLTATRPDFCFANITELTDNEHSNGSHDASLKSEFSSRAEYGDCLRDPYDPRIDGMRSNRFLPRCAEYESIVLAAKNDYNHHLSSSMLTSTNFRNMMVPYAGDYGAFSGSRRASEGDEWSFRSEN